MVETVIESLERPNGLCFSPQETLLYVVDSGSSPATIHVYDMSTGRPADGRVFVDMSPGHLRRHPLRRRRATCGPPRRDGGEGYDGVHVFAPDGTRIGQILLPERCSNLSFGGRGNNRLFMTASQSVYALYTNVVGL